MLGFARAVICQDIGNFAPPYETEKEEVKSNLRRSVFQVKVAGEAHRRDEFYDGGKSVIGSHGDR